ncbi:MAG: hypothetical protein IIY21_04280 [Clostridiales bacterium]|nr:hypothetical protein [Clostridiales bacterium]MBQ1573897.1 hypothetical protein [Clostridiales bacterium]
MDVQKFTAAVVSIVVVVILTVTVLVPIIANNTVPTTGAGSIANAASLNAIISIIPLLVVVGIILAVIGMFLYKKSN